MSQLRWQQLLIVPAAILLTFSVGCRVEQEEAGELPEVDVEAEPGQLPEYDVEGPEVDVTTEEKEVTVPEVEVTTEEETIEVPDVDVELPGEDASE
ncbi:MAG: hypothetical protein F6J97_13260 [Leptolyngbya sp. SIO4C1]|nr:hypothetical protein [Leptolyngbya sp. SIO4C1]